MLLATQAKLKASERERQEALAGSEWFREDNNKLTLDLQQMTIKAENADAQFVAAMKEVECSLLLPPAFPYAATCLSV